jgi:hypothetical protein
MNMSQCIAMSSACGGQTMWTTIAVLTLSTVVCSVDGGSIRFALTYGNDMVLQQGLHTMQRSIRPHGSECQ